VLGIKNILVIRYTPNQDLLLFTGAQIPVIKPASMPLDNAEHMQTFKENRWVLVKYEKTYPGTVTAAVGSEVEVSVKERAGKV